MSNIFSNLGNKQGVEANEDRVGGFRVHDQDIYEAEILAFYQITSTGGAKGVHLSVKFANGGLYDEDIYVTDKQGNNTYERDGKTHYLPGWNHADHIAICATGGKGLGELDVEDKTFKIWDTNAKQALPKSVPTFVETIGKKIWLAISKTIENKSVKDASGKYVPTNEQRTVNGIDKVFDFETKLTIAEATHKNPDGSIGKPAEFFDQWLAQNKGKERNNFKQVAGGGTVGKPGQNNPPQAGQSSKPSLFGKGN